MTHRTLGLAVLLACILALPAFAELTPLEQVGKALFFDENLSTPPGQACAACHAPNTGWVGPASGINAHGAVYPGAVHRRFGDRKPPSSAYATYSPDFHYDEIEGLFVGGMFWDGRALNTVAQAKGPFLNPVEQNNPNKRSVIIKVMKSEYAEAFLAQYQEWMMAGMDPAGAAIPEMMVNIGSDEFIENAYQFVAEAISAYEGSPEVNQFSSKFDAYWRACLDAGNDCEPCGLALGSKNTLDPMNILTEQEFDGLIEFGEYCAPCHVSHMPGPGGEPPLFTNFTYDNIGVPRNLENPWYTMPPSFNPLGFDWVDFGLGGRLGLEEELGKFKVPTLRNVGARPYEGFIQAYMHNGVFKSLEEVVHFYNTRDVEPWPEPEVPVNVNRELFEGVPLGDFQLDAEAEAAIVAFLNTLTDGWTDMAVAPVAEIASRTPVVSVVDSSPNPFRAETRIAFALEREGPVHVSVFDVQGRLVRNLLSGGMGASGRNEIGWDGRDEAGRAAVAGIYFVRVRAANQEAVQRLVRLP